MEKLLATSEAQKAGLREELKASQSNAQGLEAKLRKKEEEFRDKEQEASDLEIHLIDAVSKGMFWKSKTTLANQMLDIMLGLAKEADQRAKETEAKASTMKEKIELVKSRAIKDFKNLEDFKIEVEEAVYDAYLKG